MGPGRERTALIKKRRRAEKKEGVLLEKREYYSRDYDFAEIEMDPRFLQCRKEMFISFSTWLAFTAISLAVAYGLGKGPVEEYKYILGLPQWWFAVIVVSVVFTFIVIFLSLFVFQDMELSDVAETGEKKKG